MYVSGAIRLIESLQQNNHNINQSKRIEECKLQRQVNSEVNNVFFFQPYIDSFTVGQVSKMVGK